VAPASAEWFFDLYIGGAFTSNHDLKTDSPEIGLETALAEVGFDSSVTGGIRGGYWFNSLSFLGLGLDFSYFAPNISTQTRTVTACLSGVCGSGPVQFKDFDIGVSVIGLDILLRYPLLKSSAIPNGRLQPYLTVGPAFFFANTKDSTNFDPPRQTDRDISVGVKAGAGLAWQFHEHFAVFGEYRFTHFSPEFTVFDSFAGETTLSTDVNTHHLLIGASFRF
jgi:opacity protein-like surface antigen